MRYNARRWVYAAIASWTQECALPDDGELQVVQANQVVRGHQELVLKKRRTCLHELHSEHKRDPGGSGSKIMLSFNSRIPI
jgi:hypothetical protein